MNVADITLEIVRSYAQACMDLDATVEKLRAKGYDLLVVPSRGASPFIAGAASYAHALRNERYEAFDPSAPRIRPIEELYLPFTADGANDFAISTAAIRRFWSRVLAAFIRRDRNDNALRFYKYLRALSGEIALGFRLGEGGKSGRFIFIDTVVSGQAICEISNAFAEYGLDDCHFILLIDQQGDALKPVYRQQIDAMVGAGRATPIYVENIFTEDEGPAMSGIWAVTMPDLMLQAQKMIPEFDNCVGAGLCYHEVVKRPDGSNLGITISNSILRTLLFTAVRSEDESTKRFLDDFRDHVSKGRLQDQAVTKSIADPLVFASIQGVSATNVSGSHVIRAEIPGGTAEALVRSFAQSLKRDC